jgi:hypothetical protein
VCRYLADQKGALEDVLSTNVNGESCVWAACRGGDLELLKWVYAGLVGLQGVGEQGAQREVSQSAVVFRVRDPSVLSAFLGSCVSHTEHPY